MSQDSDKPLVLLTNDDGYESPALLELAKHISQIADVLIVAPVEHYSGIARGIPFGEKARKTGTINKHVFEVDDRKQIVYSADATPALCVVHAVLEIAPRKPDLCISGINYGENVGRALNYSGTIGAAIEAADFSIPSIAISQQLTYDDMFYMEGGSKAFESAARIATVLAQKILSDPPSEEFFCINVNVPHGATVETPREITSQAHINRWQWVRPTKRDFTQHFSFEYEEVSDAEWIPGTDAHALVVNKHVSMTPISWSIDANSDEYDMLSLEKLSVSE